MNLKSDKRPVALLVIFTLIWPSLVQAFFCFSVGAGTGGKHRNRHYSAPYPPSTFGAVAYPSFNYSPIRYSPVREEQQSQKLVPVAPVSSSDLMIEATPAEPGGSPVKQQIFE